MVEQAVDVLKHTHKHIEQHMDSSDVVVQIVNIEGYIGFSNGFKNLDLGYEQVVGESAFAVYEQFPEVITNLKEALDGHQLVGNVTINNHVYSVKYLPQSSKGEITSVLLVWIDVTESLEAQAKIAQSEVRFRTLFNVASDAIFLMDHKTFVDCNEATENIFRCNRAQIIGETPYRFSPERQPDGKLSEESAMDKINAALKGKPQFFEWQHIHYDGTPFDAEVALNRLDVGKEVYIQAIVRDVTERKRTERSIKKKNEELVKINEELDRFVYSASHDLRAPIASLLGLVELLKIEKTSEKIDELVTHQERSLLRLDKFIEDIVDYSRNKRWQFEISEIDFENEFNEAVEQFSFMDNVDCIKVELSVEGKANFYSDRRRIRIILNNLISNAIKYMDTGKSRPTIKLNAQIDKSQAVVRITDNGEGISENSQERLFEMFFRASNKGSGSGLGLYIVREAVDKLQGMIEVRSELKKGSTFIITLPNLR